MDGPQALARPPAGPFGVVVRVLLCLACVFVAGVFGWVVLERIHYPFELEWMEGAMGDHVARVLDGELLYVPPSYEHVAYLYHPGFFYVSALVAAVTGLTESLVALRIVSVLATLGSCAALYAIVARDGTRIGGVVAAGVFVAAFFLTGCYYDVGRIDPLLTCFLLLGIDRTRAARTARGLWLAGLFFLCAWLTKQTAALIVPFVVLGGLPGGWRRAGLFGLGVAMACGGTAFVLDLLHDGWLAYYTLELPSHHGVDGRLFELLWSHDLPPLLPAFVLLALFLRSGRERFFHAAWIGACVFGGVMSRMHVGGAENVLIPLVAAMAAAAGLGVSAVGRLLGEGVALVQVLVLFCLPFLGTKEPYPVPLVPSPESLAASERLLAEVRAATEPVFLPWHGFLTRMAGKPPTAHVMAMDDVWRSGNARAIAALQESFAARFSDRPFPRIYVSDPMHASMRQLVLGNGYRVGRVLEKEFAFRQPVGAPFHPVVMMKKGE